MTVQRPGKIYVFILVKAPTVSRSCCKAEIAYWKNLVVSTIIIYASQLESYLSRFIILIMSLVWCVILAHALRLAPKIMDRLGRTGINVTTRVMGILLVAMAMEMMLRAWRAFQLLS